VTWSEVTLSGDPLLVVGLRDKRRRLTGRRVNVDATVYEELRTVAVSALERVQRMDPVAYTPYIDPEEGEYLALDPTSLTPKPLAKRQQGEDERDMSQTGVPDAAAETTALVSMVEAADYLETIGAGQLGELPDDDFYAQAICLRNGEERIGFVTRTNPRKVLKRSIIPLGRSDEGDRLKRITTPELVLESDVHAIVSPRAIAILNRTQFQFLVSDTTLISSHVPAQVQVIDAAFTAHGLQLSAATRAALQSAAERSPRIAKRLDVFAERIAQIDAQALLSGSGFTAQDLEPEDFVKDGVIECADDRVPELLDALEGRFFSDAFSPEKRRADRFRRR
jgi:hypothetical protein